MFRLKIVKTTIDINTFKKLNGRVCIYTVSVGQDIDIKKKA